MILVAAAMAATFDLSATGSWRSDTVNVYRELDDGSWKQRRPSFALPPLGVRVRWRPAAAATSFQVGGSLRAWRTAIDREPVGWGVTEAELALEPGFIFQEDPLGQPVRLQAEVGMSLSARMIAADWFPLGVGAAAGTFVGGGASFGTGRLRPTVGARAAASLMWLSVSGNSEGTAKDFRFATNSLGGELAVFVGVEWGGRVAAMPAVVDAAP